jgi:hypothetical protein
MKPRLGAVDRVGSTCEARIDLRGLDADIDEDLGPRRDSRCAQAESANKDSHHAIRLKNE